MTLIDDVFLKLRTPKNVVKQISKKSTFRRPFDKRYGKVDQTLLKSERHHIFHIYWSLWSQLSQTNCLLVISEFLRLFVNILTPNDKYSLLDRDNLRQPIQMQLSQKQNHFLNLFLHFWKLD